MSATLYTNIGKMYNPDIEKGYGAVRAFSQVSLVVEDGNICHIQEGGALPSADRQVDCGGRTVLPGFVDPHTHPVFGQTREAEFIMRIQGKSYEEIAGAGGGIRNSVRRFREEDKQRIEQLTLGRIKTFLEYGTTSIEAKSGYGLSTADEIKSLEIIADLQKLQPLEMTPTFLGGHEVPDEYQTDREAYIRLVIDEMIPLVARRGLAKFCDVFCEKGVFTVAESRRILMAAQSKGLIAKIHADELSPFGGAELSAELRAISADHLVMASDKGIEQMAVSGVVPVLLPGTTFFLGKDVYAPARKMIAAGCEPAIATDFNPGSSTTQNMQIIWTIAALKLKMLPGELLWASSHTAARAIGRVDEIGLIATGRQADFIVLDIPNLDYLPYHYGVNHVKMTVKKGDIVNNLIS